MTSMRGGKHGALDEFIIECLRSGKYMVDADGRIFATSWNGVGFERELRQYPNKHGYVRCHLYLGVDRRSDVMVHRVVAIAHHGIPPSSNYEVDHLNANKADNRAENLEWVSRPTNMSRSFQRGTHTSQISNYKGPKRCSMHKAKLTEDEVRSIHLARERGGHLKVIAGAFGISLSNASMICSGKTWPAIHKEFHP